MHLLLWSEDSGDDLRDELAQVFPDVVPEAVPPLFFKAAFSASDTRLPFIAHARQWLPDARPVHAASIRALAMELCQTIAGVLPDDQPWALHIEPRYHARGAHHIGARAWHSATRRGPAPDPRNAGPSSEAGRQRSRLVRQTVVELLQRKRRHLLRQLRAEPAPFTPTDSLVQLILTGPEDAFLSVAHAPVPFEQRHLLSPYPGGEILLMSDKTAPSRAFAKLAEAGLRMGRQIQVGETCVDLGAAPGSWTWLARRQGAHVIAVDRSPLRDDLLRDPQVDFQSGDAFRFAPQRRVDWLLCDVIAASGRTAALLLEWLRRGWCRQFVVTLKTGDDPANDTLSLLRRELPQLTRELFLTRLCANKKEICAFGVAA
jgi:23S rRNA (cytidine2498-2'-O)-methyltransferase